jgi:predicted phosphodiesterase
MKIRLLSDLHVEFYKTSLYLQQKLTKFIPEICDDEILIIAGDLGVAGSGLAACSLNKEYKSMLEYFAKRWNYVILIPGNHEYYDRDKYCSLKDVDTMIQKECNNLGIVFLNKNSVKLDKSKFKNSKSDLKSDFVILGCTLWSESTPEAYKGMNDRLRAVLNHKELLTIHNDHKTWLSKELEKCYRKNQKAIVITHHLPLMELTHPKYLTPQFKPLNSAYASKLNNIFELYEPTNVIDSWYCGHTHEKTEKTLYGVKFLINPIGYPRESRMTKLKTEYIEI